MPSYLRRITRHVGAAPGTLRAEDASAPPTRVEAIRISRDVFERTTVEAGGALPEVRAGEVLWIDLNGHGSQAEILRVARHYGIPRLVVEDAIDIGQRPRLDVLDDAVFLSLRAVAMEGEDVRREQIGLFSRPGLVVSFQEADADSWDPIRTRLQSGEQELRGGGADFLFHALTDAVVDAYYLVMDHVADRIEVIEEEIFSELPPDVPQRLREARKVSVALRRAAWPLREALDGLGRAPESLISAATARVFEDVRDHVRQVAEVNEVLREAISANMDTYISLVGMRQNDVMKVLTLVATIFIPLTFIVGIYGMNFEYMPELGWSWGYPMVWVVMITTGVSLLIYFRRKGWV